MSTHHEADTEHDCAGSPNVSVEHLRKLLGIAQALHGTLLKNHGTDGLCHHDLCAVSVEFVLLLAEGLPEGVGGTFIRDVAALLRDSTADVGDSDPPNPSGVH